VSDGAALPALSIVIPTLDEAARLGALVQDLRRVLAADAPWSAELVVADGGSTDATRESAASLGARVVDARRGRGSQLRAGAAAARGEWLLFLHGDVRLSPLVDAVLAQAIGTRYARTAWWFPLRIDAPGWPYRVVEWGANARSRLAGLPYGDQGLLVHRALYDAAGGYDDVPLMEDVLLVRRLARRGRLRPLPIPITVSARRWERDGVLRRTLHNWAILGRWLLGASPESLAKRYR
jgi:rSAM/selenodomain-associated transferase 2